MQVTKVAPNGGCTTENCAKYILFSSSNPLRNWYKGLEQGDVLKMVATSEQGTEPWHAFPSSNPQDISQAQQIPTEGSLAGSLAFLTLQSLFTSSKLRMTDLQGQHKGKKKSEF